MKIKISKPTLLDYAIMGLLQSESLSGYRIRKEFEESALGNYSSSPGTIYPALKRLTNLQLVSKIIPSQSSKAGYTLSNQGKVALKEWMEKSIVKEDVEKRLDELLLRFAFMDPLVNTDKKLEFLSELKKLLKIYISELSEYLLQESGNLPVNGRLAFEHGILSAKSTLKWCNLANKHLKK